MAARVGIGVAKGNATALPGWGCAGTPHPNPPPQGGGRRNAFLTKFVFCSIFAQTMGRGQNGKNQHLDLRPFRHLLIPSKKPGNWWPQINI